MQPGPPGHSFARFADFKLDMRTGELRKDEGGAIRLPEQSFQILVMLLERPGEVVGREEIQKRLWPNNTVVEFEHSISAAMNRLRQALGDRAGNPTYIETLARRGYRWMRAVEWVDNGKSPVPFQEPPGPPPASPAASLIGKMVSHYRVLEVIGGGGMGIVYKAEDIKLGRKVALKFLPEELAHEPNALDRFEREARSASALSHANICTIHGIEEHDGQPFIVMELLKGETLRDVISVDHKPLELRMLVDLAVQIATGLEVAHQKGIIHRDIKPSNIFITRRGEAKILDFGLAKASAKIGSDDESETQTADFDSHLTSPGAMLGTVAYMSPEQVRAKEIDARSDLFSFGAVLYEMATGRMPFPGESSGEICGAILHKQPVPPSRLNLHVLPGMEAVILRALEKNRDLRYQQAADMRAELERLRRDGENKRFRAAGSISAMIVTAPAVESVNTPKPYSGFHSLAVLPFANGTGPPEAEYLSEGISESIINLLSQFPDLRVVPRTSAFRYKGVDRELKEIGHDLRVDVILTGAVIQRGDRLIVQTELVDVKRDAQIWGSQFNRKFDDIFELQEELARGICERLRPRLTPEENRLLTKRPTENREAYLLYLKAMYHANKWTWDGIGRGLDFCRQAIETDPIYARAHTALAYLYVLTANLGGLPPSRAFPMAKSAALTALEIDETLSDAHATLAYIHMAYDWDWPSAENECRRALLLAPDHSQTQLIYSDWCLTSHRTEEAIAAANRAVDLDPLSHINHHHLALIFHGIGRYESAIEALRRAIAIEPSFVVAHQLLALAYANVGKSAEAIAELECVFPLCVETRSVTRAKALAGMVHGLLGNLATARSIVSELLQASEPPDFLFANECASIFTLLNERDLAFEYLEKAYLGHSGSMMYIGVRPMLFPLHDDPRFSKLLEKMGLPSHS